MKKSDLKTGMVVELRNGKKGMVLLDTKDGDIISGEYYGRLLSYFREDLTSDISIDYDIIKIYQPEAISYYLYYYNNHIHFSNRNCIWERKEQHSYDLNELKPLIKYLNEDDKNNTVLLITKNGIQMTDNTGKFININKEGLGNK